MGKRPGIRLRDVALIAQVAESTVSKVLAGKATVSDETRLVVLAAAESLGYRQMKRTMAIGILAGGDSPLKGSVPFTSEVFHGIEQICQAQEVGLMFSSVQETSLETFTDMPVIVQRHQIEGAILVNLFDHNWHSLLTQAEMPFVFVGHHVDFPRVDTVVCNDEKGGYLATRYLLERGHRIPPPAFIGATADRSSLYHRYLGYRRALAEACIAYDERYVWLSDDTNMDQAEAERHSGDERGREGVKRFLQLPEPPTAIFCCTDLTAYMALDQLRQSGIQVPEQCSLVGFDGSPVLAHSILPLTTIQAPNEVLGMEAARLLLSRLEHPHLPGRHIHLDVELVERGSVVTRANE